VKRLDIAITVDDEEEEEPAWRLCWRGDNGPRCKAGGTGNTRLLSHDLPLNQSLIIYTKGANTSRKLGFLSADKEITS
jgi:hypothetical protein